MPKADAMLVMPATFNTINKWAQGIGDTLVTSILCEALGRGITTDRRRPLPQDGPGTSSSLLQKCCLLRECGVHVLHEPERYPSPLMVPWNEILATLLKVTQSNEEG